MRRHQSDKRAVIPDLKFNDATVAVLVTKIMERGKKSVAESIVYGALDYVKEQTNADPIEVFKQALENAKPRLEVKSRRVGGATYQVPVEVPNDRQAALAMRWIVLYAKTRKGVSMRRALGLELLDAYKNQGNAIKKRDDTHKMAQANKAFAHYRW